MTFYVNDITCTSEVQLLMKQSDGSFALHDNSIITKINGVSTNTLQIPASNSPNKLMNVSGEYSDLSMDSDGTSAAPKFEFLIEIGSPIIATAGTVA